MRLSAARIVAILIALAGSALPSVSEEALRHGASVNGRNTGPAAGGFSAPAAAERRLERQPDHSARAGAAVSKRAATAAKKRFAVMPPNLSERGGYFMSRTDPAAPRH